MKLQELKVKLVKNPVPKVVNKFILGNQPICFEKYPDLIDEIKYSLSNHFYIHQKDIEIVGSAKLGISLNPDKMGTPYNDHSDIDFVLISSGLFDRAWHELLLLDFKNYDLSTSEQELIKDSYKGISHGFIRPDKIPPKTSFYEYWWKIFNELSGKNKYEYRKIRGRLFKNWWFVEKYYTLQLVKLKKQ